FHDQTVRMIVHPHQSGDKVRIHLSNEYGNKPLTFKKASIAKTASEAKVHKNTLTAVTFEGNDQVTIQPGQMIWSDPLNINVNSGEDLTVSLYVPENSGSTTWHAHAMQTSYVADGDMVGESAD